VIAVLYQQNTAKLGHTTAPKTSDDPEGVVGFIRAV